MRVVLLSWALRPAAGLFRCLEATGHRVEALVTVRRPDGRASPLSERDLVRHRQLLEHAPPGLDIVVAAGAGHLERMVGALRPDLLVCASFPCRVDERVLAIPRLGALNVHPSLLPRYRGPNPVGRAVMDGAGVGLSVHRMVRAFDAGPVLAQRPAPVEDGDDAAAILDRIDRLLDGVLQEAVGRAADGEPGDAQDRALATYAPLFDDEELVVSWERPARRIHDQVRACALASSRSGRRGATGAVDGHAVRILRTRLDPSHGGYRVDCGDAPIWVLEMEPVPAPVRS